MGPRRGRSVSPAAVGPLMFDPDPELLLGRSVIGPLLLAPSFGDLIRLQNPPSHAFRIVRPRDLVHLHVLVYLCELRPTEGGPELVPKDPAARLEVRFPFQHLAERAWFKVDWPTPPDVPPHIPPEAPGSEAPKAPPTEARAAHGTRLVFDIPEDEAIGFSAAGVLAALSRLPLRVHKLATPRSESRRLPPVRDPLSRLGPGQVLVREEHGLIVRSAPRSARASTLGDPVANSIRAARDAINARRFLAVEAAVDLSKAPTGDLARPPVIIRIPKREVSPPAPDQTAIEAPYRLIVSPSVQGGFAHSDKPVGSPTDDTRVELWHSRLGVRQKTDDGWRVDERPDPQRIVRAVWTRDIDLYGDDPPATNADPFRASLDPRDRRILVRQTAETSLAAPEPADVERLYLSSLGAWLDLHGQWDTDPYTSRGKPAILSWDHVAPMGRDQFVRVVYPGYLFPFGHRAAIVKVTERRITDDPNPQARLFQRKFIVVGEPTRSYQQNDLPFREVRVRPLVVPNLWDPLDTSEPLPITPHVIIGQDLFWPVVEGQKFRFTLECLDHDGQRTRLHVPLLFVADHFGVSDRHRQVVSAAYDDDNAADAAGQWAAFARSTVPGDTAFEVGTFHFGGDPEIPGGNRAVPRMKDAKVVIPAMRHLSPKAGPVTVCYDDTFKANGFDATTQVFLRLDQATEVSFTSGSDRGGGFVEPNLPVTQLSRSKGAIGNLVPPAAGGGFDPSKLLEGSFPKLFGLFDLAEVLQLGGLDDLPQFVTEALDRVAALITDLQRLVSSVDSSVDRLVALAGDANATVKAQLDAVRTQLQAVQGGIQTQVQLITTAFDEVLQSGTKSPDQVIAAITGALGQLVTMVDKVDIAVKGSPLPPTVKADLERLVGAIRPVLDAADLLDAIEAFLGAIDPQGLSVRARYVWKPVMKPWPATGPAVFVPKPDSFTLSVEARVSAAGGGAAGVDVLAELRDFNLDLLPGVELMRMKFGRIAFRASSGRKPEVDVVFNGIEFLGVLGFIETLRELIPFDGFADPPHLDVSPEGVTAGFDLGLPNVAVGVFSLENISLGADCRVPFLGDAVTVGFNFCTRERPFRLTVMAIGGGGFVAIRLSPEGLVVLEMALEAGASLSLDFGVASGSVSVMIGIYLRLEADKGSLTGYLRIRGEVDVLGLISASITLELSLTYEFASGKMVGRASIVVEVEVLGFSESVEVSVERRLAGSNGDPTFAQIMDVSESGVSPFWDDYCRAFAEV